MKLHLNSATGQNAITGHGPGFVQVNQTRVSSALIVLPDRLLAPWEIASAGTLTSGFAVLISRRSWWCLVLARVRFPDPSIMAAFSQARIGFEAMDTRLLAVQCADGRGPRGGGRNAGLGSSDQTSPALALDCLVRIM
jgi:uncharacterized protein